MDLERLQSDVFVVTGNFDEAQVAHTAMARDPIPTAEEDMPRIKAHEQLRGVLPAPSAEWRVEMPALGLSAFFRAVRHLAYQPNHPQRALADTMTDEIIEKAAKAGTYYSR